MLLYWLTDWLKVEQYYLPKRSIYSHGSYWVDQQYDKEHNSYIIDWGFNQSFSRGWVVGSGGDWREGRSTM